MNDYEWFLFTLNEEHSTMEHFVECCDDMIVDVINKMFREENDTV